ncbi:MAG: DUF2889 domain-containing protein, partial [Desulfobacteraceae bacterium]|nr:DUF2889 domain-containing protein [Desulfobacteraceae bacterium]
IKNKKKIHTRDIKLATYAVNDSELIVCGTLLDERLQTIFDITEKEIPPGKVHHMQIYLLIHDNPLRITKVEASMPHVPMSQCKETLDVIKKVEGLEIKGGFSKKVNEFMGSTKGCTHLTHLLTVMGQEIVHGWLTEKRKYKTEAPESIDDFTENSFIINSCKLWTKDGPKIKAIKEAIEKKGKQASF